MKSSNKSINSQRKKYFNRAITSLLFVMGTVLLIITCVMNIFSLLSRDEICQKHFGKDYVYRNGCRSPDFCVGDSGVPKYPKSWIERRDNA